MHLKRRCSHRGQASALISKADFEIFYYAFMLMLRSYRTMC